LTVSSSEERTEALLATVRSFGPRDLLRLAGLWAGVSYGSLDPHRQRRRNGARAALRYLADEDGRHAFDARTAVAAAAVAEALATGGERAAASLRGPAADATFAVADALDALAYADRLSRVAYDELMRPWEELQEQRAFEEDAPAEDAS